MKKSIDQQYLNIRNEIQNHFQEMERDSKIEMVALKTLIVMAICTLLVISLMEFYSIDLFSLIYL